MQDASLLPGHDAMELRMLLPSHRNHASDVTGKTVVIGCQQEGTRFVKISENLQRCFGFLLMSRLEVCEGGFEPLSEGLVIGRVQRLLNQIRMLQG